MKKIVIENLKDIQKMEFTIPQSKGVYLISGSNGCGKTTLLVCLERICNNYAFAYGFTKTSSWNAADQYDNAVITYCIDNQNVSYRKTKAKWAPTPRKDSEKILHKFGFSDSIFIKADSNRIDVKKDDLVPGNFTTVDRSYKDALNRIFETDKYDRLQRVKNTYGRGRGAVYFYVLREGSGANTKYYSEKRFSTGELAMVRLVEQIETVKNGSLVLLDEAELALHPRVQVKLLDYLREKAEEKSLWIFISTHSPSMIKNSDRKEIIVLKKETGYTEVINPCYPAHAIGEIDFQKSNIFDYIFFVEDDKALLILQELRKRYVVLKPEHAKALCNIIPVGGFYETARLAVLTNTRVFAHSTVFAVVDEDATNDLENKPKFEKLFKDNGEIIRTLTFTPEVWLIQKLEVADKILQEKIKDNYHVELTEILHDADYMACNSPKERQRAKDKFAAVVKYLWSVMGGSEEVVAADLIRMVIDSIEDGEVMKVCNPLFTRKKSNRS